MNTYLWSRVRNYLLLKFSLIIYWANYAKLNKKPRIAPQINGMVKKTSQIVLLIPRIESLIVIRATICLSSCVKLGKWNILLHSRHFISPSPPCGIPWIWWEQNGQIISIKFGLTSNWLFSINLNSTGSQYTSLFTRAPLRNDVMSEGTVVHVYEHNGSPCIQSSLSLAISTNWILFTG